MFMQLFFSKVHPVCHNIASDTFKRGGRDTFAKVRNLKSKRLSSSSVKRESPKEIQEDFMVTLGKKSPSYSRVKQWAAEFKCVPVHIRIKGEAGAVKLV